MFSLVLDLGTTGVKGFVFAENGEVVSLLKMQEELFGCTIERQTTKDATALGVPTLLRGR